MGHGNSRQLSCPGENNSNNNTKRRISRNIDDSDFKILNLEAKIDDRPIEIKETEKVLIYITPKFRASAKIQIPPLLEGEEWQIGWIQACDYMTFINYYGNQGCTSWEIPQLRASSNNENASRKSVMISDSDGRFYPWYGETTEVVCVQGPEHSFRTVRVAMDDNFSPKVAWSLTGEYLKPNLTKIHRSQSFYTWLAARNSKTGFIVPLKTIRWKIELDIKINRRKGLGHRATDTSNFEITIQEKNRAIPNEILGSPNANSAQTFVWLGKNGERRIILPAKSEWTSKEEKEPL
ncbi:protein FAM78A [Lingula anatina]|uniref:Protein FAM78A n=1 Tax=Lingula anatina TaxID=7574 RepID=A0A1S3IJT9_LINAN|nr:protein FAM78A [Lingula anatina]|eukprot:XP_013398151.1 protein FAM78A [Lingula anatina]